MTDRWLMALFYPHDIQNHIESSILPLYMIVNDNCSPTINMAILGICLYTHFRVPLKYTIIYNYQGKYMMALFYHILNIHSGVPLWHCSPRRSRSARLLRTESRDGIKEPEPTVPGAKGLHLTQDDTCR